VEETRLPRVDGPSNRRVVVVELSR
jgi:hypothetical protein